ncbi:geranylgeranyl transferase type-2 subunit alpha-like [Diadema antillarum]|uniref:geranylgeranyl transferase type-2 subunit alpha-like n=1 Tax=Diadema antillarum TaxID=105358 RepID=UPI003A867640
MHGRLKVKTTAEQQEAKRKEREKKLKLFTAGTNKVFEKRKNKEFDGEILEVSAQLLSANPDFYTLWNVRKETLEAFQQTKSEDEMQEIFSKELGFIEACLRVNPKSYGAWHHRCWVMDHSPHPDWEQELKLCTMYLEYDERNFHCWDYRRFVVARSKVPPSEELQFTATKISSNFSNYSSWHYRSKLLPLLHPDQERKGRLQEDVLLQEYDLVQNAFFTDPNDQSAWFYHRWLLGRSEKPMSIQTLCINRPLNQLMTTFSRPVNLHPGHQRPEVLVNGGVVKGKWKNSRGTTNHSIMWIFELSENVLRDAETVEVRLDRNVSRMCQLSKDVLEGWSREEQEARSLFTAELSDEKSELLKSELESCQQLQELEPENKWCLLTIILLMRAVDPLKHETEMLRYFQTLLTQDPYRQNYFRDLRSKFVMENAIMRHLQGSTQGSEGTQRSLDLSGKELSTLHHLHHLSSLQSIDISNNQLASLSGANQLFCVSSLVADGNRLQDISHLANLPLLESLSLKDNQISTLSQLQSLSSCTALRSLDVSNNAVCEVPDFTSKVKEILPQITTLNGVTL